MCLDESGQQQLQHCHLLFSPFFIVDVLLKAVGDTPIMKTKKWMMDRGRTVQSLSQFISRYLKLDASEQLVRMKLPKTMTWTETQRKHDSGLQFLMCH